MIITQTPLRISLAGGGTDLPDFSREHGGCVVSTAIDKCIYVIVKARFDRKIRVGYSRTEMVDDVSEVQHELVREALRMTGVCSGVEIATMADIPSEGSGLGSSSSVTVGVLHALYTYQGHIVPPERLAEEACRIEIEVLGKPIGKQDQYIAAFGGFRFIEFGHDGSVQVQPLALSEDKRRALDACLLLFYTGRTRDANAILSRQRGNIAARADTLLAMAEQARELRVDLENGHCRRVAEVLHENWCHKRTLAEGISNGELDGLYERACAAGATGGKVAGAGGGGFLLLYCPPGEQERLREALSDHVELPFHLAQQGTRVLLNAQR